MLVRPGPVGWSAWSVVAIFACASMGCLDAGPPPLGRHLLATRDEEGLTLVAGPPGGAAHIVVSHRQKSMPSEVFATAQMSLVDDPIPPVGPRASRAVIDHQGGSSAVSVCTPSGCGPAVDALGRAYFDRLTFVPTEFPGAIGQQDELVQVDLTTGQEQSFGAIYTFSMSAGGTRFSFFEGGDFSRGDAVVVELDGSRTTLPRVRLLKFVGEDALFVDDMSRLMRLPPGTAEPVPVGLDVQSFSVYDTQRGNLILLLRHPFPAPFTTSVLDPVTFVETALPAATAAASTFVPSPSGRYLATTSSGGSSAGAPGIPTDTAGITTLTLFDRDTGVEQTMSMPQTPALRTPVWRPQPEEAWFVILEGGVWRWQPGSEATVVASASGLSTGGPPFIAVSLQEPRLYDLPSFTPDGRFRVVTGIDFSRTGPVFLQSADDAAAPPFLLNPEGTGLAGLWPLADGRLLVEAWIGDPKRNDVYLADPTAGTSRALASTGNVVAVGRRRFLALQHWVAATHAGDLTLIDDETGAATLIAENVYAVAVDAAVDPGDVLAPGTRVVFLVRNRIASPYDGCWATELP